MTQPAFHLTPAGTVELPIDSIAPDPGQPRSTFRHDELAELAESIRAHRVVQPIVVTAHPEPGARPATPYMILVGERRWRSARLAQLATIPAVVRADEISSSDRILYQLAENEDRSELSLFERALAYHRAYRLSQLSQNAFAQRCGKTKGAMSQLLRVAKAQGLLREALDEGLLNHVQAARLFEDLAPCAQLPLLEAARRNGRPITHWRLQEARGRREAALAGEPASEERPARTAAALRPAAARSAPTAPTAPAAIAAPKAITAPTAERAIPILFTHAMLSTNLRFLGAKPLPTLRGAAAQLCALLAAAAE